MVILLTAVRCFNSRRDKKTCAMSLHAKSAARQMSPTFSKGAMEKFLKDYTEGLWSSSPLLVTGQFYLLLQMPGTEPRGDKNVCRRQVLVVRIHEVSRIRAPLKGH